jgi:hypothetical protein
LSNLTATLEEQTETAQKSAPNQIRQLVKADTRSVTSKRVPVMSFPRLGIRHIDFLSGSDGLTNEV